MPSPRFRRFWLCVAPRRAGLWVLALVLLATACKKETEDTPPQETPLTDLYDAWMMVNGELWTTRSTAATYDTTLGTLTLELTRATAAAARERIIITFNGPLQPGVNGQFGLNLSASFSPAPGVEAPATSFDLHLNRYEAGKLWAKFWGRMETANGTVYEITDGNLENLYVALTGDGTLNTDGILYAQSSFGDWYAELKSAKYEDGVLRIQGIRGYFGNTEGFTISLPVALGDTGTYNLNATPGMGGNYAHYQFGTHFWTAGALTLFTFNDTTVSGVFYGDYANPFTGVEVSVQNGVFQNMPLVVE